MARLLVRTVILLSVSSAAAAATVAQVSTVSSSPSASSTSSSSSSSPTSSSSPSPSSILSPSAASLISSSAVSALLSLTSTSSSTSSPLPFPFFIPQTPYGKTVMASVALVAVVLIVGLPLVCIYMCRSNKIQDPSTSSKHMATNHRSHTEIPLSVCDYEKIPNSYDTPSSVATEPTHDPDNSGLTAPLPISPPDDYQYITTDATSEEPIYTSADIPLSPSEECSDSMGESPTDPSILQLSTNLPGDAIYSAAEIHTIPSDYSTVAEVQPSPWDPTYHLAQLPTSPTDRSINPQPPSCSGDMDHLLAELPRNPCYESTDSLMWLAKSTSVDMVYSLASNPTEEEPIYSNADPSTNPSDDPMYSTTEAHLISQNPIYSAMELPTNPSNDPTYDFPGVPLDSHNPTYPAMELPAALCDDSIYSTADGPVNPSLDSSNCADQLPTILSHDPTYYLAQLPTDTSEDSLPSQVP